MKEYQVLASIYDDLLTPKAVTRTLLQELGHCTTVHTIKCDSIDEIPDLFLDRYGNECIYMRNCIIYWYVKTESGWQCINC